jgi:hypothetical protein
MNKEELITKIIVLSPKMENGKNGVPQYGPIVYKPIFEKYGQLVLGIGEYWSWFTKRNFEKGHIFKSPSRSFLEDAEINELEELYKLLINKYE